MCFVFSLARALEVLNKNRKNGGFAGISSLVLGSGPTGGAIMLVWCKPATLSFTFSEKLSVLKTL